jgi:hypothetical protein
MVDYPIKKIQLVIISLWLRLRAGSGPCGHGLGKTKYENNLDTFTVI